MFRFTIRDLLWLMVVVGLGLMLLLERSRNAELRSHALLLRDSFSTTRFFFRPIDPRQQMNDSINWDLADAPIP